MSVNVADTLDEERLKRNHRMKELSVFRNATGFLRCRPSIFTIGAQKAGTTSVFYQLRNHPQILQPYRKEIWFFNNLENYQRGP